MVSRSKQIAGTFELIHRLCVWKCLTKLVMTILYSFKKRIYRVCSKSYFNFFFFFIFLFSCFAYVIDVTEVHKFAHNKYINELFFPKQKHNWKSMSYSCFVSIKDFSSFRKIQNYISVMDLNVR